MKYKTDEELKRAVFDQVWLKLKNYGWENQDFSLFREEFSSMVWTYHNPRGLPYNQVVDRRFTRVMGEKRTNQLIKVITEYTKNWKEGDDLLPLFVSIAKGFVCGSPYTFYCPTHIFHDHGEDGVQLFLVPVGWDRKTEEFVKKGSATKPLYWAWKDRFLK